jgi:anaerobic selenocysteine-containing dehydrogenase
MADHTAQRIHTYCGLCIARCGAVAVVEDNRFTRLEPDPGHPTGQALCAKGRAAPGGSCSGSGRIRLRICSQGPETW